MYGEKYKLQFQSVSLQVILAADLKTVMILFMFLENRVSSAHGLLNLSQVTNSHMGCQISYFSLACALALGVKSFRVLTGQTSELYL